MSSRGLSSNIEAMVKNEVLHVLSPASPRGFQFANEPRLAVGAATDIRLAVGAATDIHSCVTIITSETGEMLVG